MDRKLNVREYVSELRGVGYIHDRPGLILPELPNSDLGLLSYINNTHNCSNSQDISKRILCLPLYNDLSIGDAKIIVSIIEECNL